MIKHKPIKHKLKNLFPKLKKELKKDKNILFAYIFGSYGKGKITPLSDVDIAVYLVNVKEYFNEKLKIIGKINEILETDEVDLVILNEANLSLQFEVIKTGELLFCKNKNLRIKFITKVVDLYCDFEYHRKIQNYYLMKRIKEGRYGY